MKYTKKQFDTWLDEIAPDSDSDEWIIGGERRRGRYSQALRRHDPIGYQVGYQEWKREAEYNAGTQRRRDENAPSATEAQSRRSLK